MKKFRIQIAKGTAFALLLALVCSIGFTPVIAEDTADPLQNPTTIELPFVAEKDNRPDTIVLYENRGDQDPRHLIPRSWYEEETLYGKVYSLGTYGAINMEWGQFADTQGKWMDPAVQYLSCRGVVQGVTNPTLQDGIMTAQFAPNNAVTRGEFVTMLMRLLDTDIRFKLSTPFNDQETFPEWAAPSIHQATGLGIVQGDAKGNFNPLNTITRQDMFVMTARAMDRFGMTPEIMTMQFILFSDWDDTASYAQEPIQMLARLGLAAGSEGALRPKALATRAEAAQFLYSVLKFDAKQ